MCVPICSSSNEQSTLGSDDSQEVPPVPIPNTEVKLYDADGTAGATLWESRLSLSALYKPPAGQPSRGFLCFGLKIAAAIDAT